MQRRGNSSYSCERHDSYWHRPITYMSRREHMQVQGSSKLIVPLAPRWPLSYISAPYWQVAARWLHRQRPHQKGLHHRKFWITHLFPIPRMT
eukprot:459905-Pyramimonas_sp.AAC.1